MSAIMTLHHGYSGYTIDQEGVAAAPDGTQTTVLYRRVPDLKERTYESVMYILTSSLWHWLPGELKPAGGAGRCFLKAKEQSFDETNPAHRVAGAGEAVALRPLRVALVRPRLHDGDVVLHVLDRQQAAGDDLGEVVGRPAA